MVTDMGTDRGTDIGKRHGDRHRDRHRDRQGDRQSPKSISVVSQRGHPSGFSIVGHANRNPSYFPDCQTIGPQDVWPPRPLAPYPDHWPQGEDYWPPIILNYDISETVRHTSITTRTGRTFGHRTLRLTQQCINENISLWD